MLLAETLAVALSALRANPLRSLLTMLGIVIGIGAVIAMVALGHGAEQSIQERIAALGTTIVQVNPQRVRQAGVVMAGTLAKLTVADAQAIGARAPDVVAVNYQQDANEQIVFQDRNTNLRIVGTVPNFLEVRGYEVVAGRMFTAREEAGRERVAVVGADVGEELGLTDSLELLGRRIRIASQDFTVIGVLGRKGVAGFDNPNEQILIPFSTGRFRVFGTDRLNDIRALASSEATVNAAMDETAMALRRSHRLRFDQPDDFMIRNQSDFLQTLGETTETFSLLLAGIAAVSLVVGGIGIMNIMLVSVTERTREIGVRKALGATRRNVLLQFLVEAVVLCMLGGTVGIALGIVGSARLAAAMGWHAAPDWQSIGIAFLFASAVGVAFGVWPAQRAARMDPVVALRYE